MSEQLRRCLDQLHCQLQRDLPGKPRVYCGLYSKKFDSVVSLDRNCACGSVYQDQCSGMCGDNVDFAYTLYNTWVNRTCTGVSSFSGMPANWEANLLIIDDSKYFALDSAPVPAYLSCMDSTCRQTLTESLNRSITTCCGPD